MKTKLSNYLLFVFMVVSLISSGCGAVAPVPTLTPTIANTATKTLEPTKTLTPTATIVPTRTPRPTSTPDIAATQKYDGLQAQVEKLASDGVIPSVEGKYYALDDYSKAFAKIRYYTWATYDMVKPTNFIIQAKVKIENATTEGAYKSGCGFIMQNFFDDHGVFLSLDGNANYWSDGYDRGSNYLDATLYEQNPDGVTLTLVLSNKALTMYVNDRMALSGITIYGEPFYVGPAILSGTSEGFGTRCDFTEMSLWEIK